MATSDALIQSTTRHAVHLEGLKAGQVKRLEKFLRRIDKDLRKRLQTADLTAFSRARAERLLGGVDKMLESTFERYQAELRGELDELAQYEAEFEARNLDQVLVEGSGYETVIPASKQVQAAVFTSPLSVRGAGGGKLLEPFVADWTKTERQRVVGAIRQGFFEGQTNAEIIRALRGTKANSYRDGVLATTARNADAVVRTAVQHTASTARSATWQANQDLVQGYRWVSTLDSRTSTQCRSLDGRVFKLDKGPKPPIHIRCRSTTVAELNDDFKFLSKDRTRASMDGPVDADTSYYDWLKDQAPEFQDDVLGQVRGKLFRDGGLSPERFARLNLGRDFRPLTIPEMRRREPLAFKRAFTNKPQEPVDVNPAEIEQKARDYVTSNGRRQGVEFAYIADRRAGKVLLRKRGESRAVKFTNAEIAAIKAGDEVELYHNHPSGSSLSGADLGFGASTGIKKVVAFATRGPGHYIASNFAALAKIDRAFGAASRFSRDVVRSLQFAGTLDEAQAYALQPHLVNSLLDRAGVIKYEAREISEDTALALRNVGGQFDEWLEEFDSVYFD